MIAGRLGHYQVGAKLGEGGMGEVFRATDTKLGRAVALKVLPSEMARDPERLARFQREARAIAALNHPHIVTIYSVDEIDGVHFLTMELIEGQALTELIPDGGMPVDRTIAIGSALADALAAAHDKGIVHRDLKPANVMVTNDGRVKVLDFGLAKELRSTHPADATLTSAGHTQIGVVMGTPAYMSPEQVAGRPMDHRTDIFSLGVLLYQMASGERPFDGVTSIELASAILRDTPRPLGELRHGVPADFARLVRRCLEKDPARRVQTARDVGNELREIARSPAPVVPAPSTPSRTPASGTDAAIDEGFWVAVRPFKYSGANADLAALGEGLPEEIVTALLRFSYLRVLAAGTATANARYVIDGSIRQAGSTIRVAAQVIDQATGAHLWAETYDRQFQPDQIFALQDELVPRIVSTCGDRFGVLARSISDVVRGRPADRLSPYEALMLGFGYHHRLSPGDHAAARDALERGIEQAPRNADCLAMLSWIYSHEFGHGFNPQPASLDRAFAMARRAVDAAPSNQLAYQALAVALFFRKETTACLNASARAMALNPNDGSNEAMFITAFTGDWERGCDHVRRAMDLNPHHPAWFGVVFAINEYRKANYRAAIDETVKMNAPGLFWTPMLLSAAYGQLGDDDAAATSLKDLLRLQPDFAQSGRVTLSRWLPPDLTEHYVDGLRKAGLEIDAKRTHSTRARTLKGDEGFWVAVLPFKCASANADLVSLAEGLSEEIVTGLSRFSYLRVIARASMARYANTPIDVREVGKEIGARYVMEGTVRQAGSQLRVTTQLVDTSTGAHLWAETYNRSFRPDAIFDVQDDLVPRIVSTVADMYGVLPRSMSDRLRGRRADELSPFEAALRACGYYERVGPDEHAEVRDILEYAVKAAPTSSDCWSLLASLYLDEYRHGFNPRSDPLGRAADAARRALETNPTSHIAYQVLASVLFFRREIAPFRNAAARTMTLNPMAGGSVAFMGVLIAYAGDWDNGCAIIERAAQLNSNPPGWYWIAPCLNAYRKGEYQAALEIAAKINLPDYFYTHIVLAAIYGQLGHHDAARAALTRLLMLNPGFAATAREEIGKWYEPALVERLIDGLEKAGLGTPTGSAIGLSRATGSGAHAVTSTPSIAVLPFANLSADKDQEYFSDGLADEIINSLAQVSGLKVIARTSAFAFRGKEQDIREIARALGVTTVLQGSVRRAGTRVRVSAQLIAAADGAHLWSERFDREIIEVFAIQDEIAAAIVSALKVTLTGAPSTPRSYEPNVAAYEAFLRGRHQYYQFSPEHFAIAEQDFLRAIELDPGWAEPHASLGDLYFALAFYGWRPFDDMIARAREEARRALDLVPSHPLGHAVLGIVAAHHDYNWAEAEDRFSRVRASEFVPPNVHLLSLFYLLSLGRFDTAHDEMAKAIAEDPLNSFWRARRVWALQNANRHDEAIAEARKALELDPTNYQARMMMALSFTCQGHLALALDASEAVYRTSSFDAFNTGLLGGILSRLGEKERAEQVVATMTGAVTIGMTIYHLIAGEIDAALDWYQKDIEAHRPNAPMVAFAAWLAPMRASPRWARVAAMMNLPVARG